jgi:hypothetical protein
MQPLTPQSCADFRSPLDEARAEIAIHKAEVARLRKEQQFKTDARVLRLQLDNANYRAFLKEHGLLIAFRQQYPF